MSTFRPGWYVVYTKPRHEKKVHTRLTEKNIASILPTKKVLRSWHDRKKYVEEPLFPSYIFIQLNSMHDYYGGIEEDSVLYYVKTGKEIARVSETIVDNIRLASSHGSEIEVSDQHFQPSRRLVIQHGVLTGLTGEFVKYENKKKLLIRVSLLQRSILLSLPDEYLIPEDHLMHS